MASLQPRKGVRFAHERARDRRTATLRRTSLRVARLASIILSAIAMGFGLLLELEARPGRTAFVAIVLALVSARLSERHQSLALKAALFAMVAWVVGMTLAVLTENPLI